MLKFIPEDTSIVFLEIPDQISLAINISGCPHRCPDCHSPYLREDIGECLTISSINDIINTHKGITCVLFMGGDRDKQCLITLASYVKSKGLLTGWYSGEDTLDISLYKYYFDYIKVGSYKKELGPLNADTTNQRLYRINGDCIEDITYRFLDKSSYL